MTPLRDLIDIPTSVGDADFVGASAVRDRRRQRRATPPRWVGW
jgi:hypothetical protein